MGFDIKKFTKLKQEAIKKITPEGKTEKLIAVFLEKFIKQIEKNSRNVDFFIGGSFAKNTTIKKNKYDVDLFAIFGKKEKNISEQLKDILRKSKVKFTILHGSRDYYSIKFNDTPIPIYLEVVPVLRIKNSKEAENITDVSPLHVSYVKAKIKNREGLNDEIRLVKAFCYSQNCYGAESYMGGFSGYSLELLTIYYGNFLNFIKKVAKWNEMEIIDPEKKFKKKEDVLKTMNKSKLIAPLILVDPVQEDRNATAALSKQKYDLLKKSCRNFLNNMNLEFFEKKEISVENMLKEAKRRKSLLGILKIYSRKNKEDVCYAKESKFADFFIYKAMSNGFKIYQSLKSFSNRETILYFVYNLPDKTGLIQGPPIKMEKNVADFRRKHKNTIVKNKKIYAKITRKILNLNDFIPVFERMEEKTIKEMSIDKISLVNFDKI